MQLHPKERSTAVKIALFIGVTGRHVLANFVKNAGS